MKNWTLIQAQYLQKSIPERLMDLADRLSQLSQSVQTIEPEAKVSEAAASEAKAPGAKALVEESRLFIEWTALETGLDNAAALVELQIQLTRWQLLWSKIEADPTQHSAMQEESGQWSQRITQMSEQLAKPMAIS
jgi:hypothetical protein